ncbi:P-loop NTPase fold protein [Novosphingobium sp.]|uniref:P-loop NTPase fold protein n=1 Tax=Novosphingobium sp. TaxID=1874826 RepID=UPI0026345AED|nr:P-loop NTPase fold protein [Novosphingobium sp.]
MSGASPAIAALITAEGLPETYLETVERFWRPLAETIAAAQVGKPLIVGISGSQGSGKSTLCRCLEVMLHESHGLSASTLSLDDLYLTRRERAHLAATVHPLLATRGVPGTHDVALGEAVLAAVREGRTGLRLPRFDKACDDRASEADWPVLAKPIDVLLLEGWCIAATPQAPAALAEPVNRLEAEEDPDGAWRAYVNAALEGPYRALFAQMDFLIMLEAPGFEAVPGWRQEQERKLRARSGGGMNDSEIERFVMHYERITRHLLEELPGRAGAVVSLSADHAVAGLAFAAPLSSAGPANRAQPQ